MEINPELISEMHQKLETIHDSLIGNKLQGRKGVLDRMEDVEQSSRDATAKILDMNIKMNEIKSKIEKNNKARLLTALSSGGVGAGIGAASTDPTIFKKILQFLIG